MPPEAERGGARTAGEDRGSPPTDADARRQAKGREQALPGPQRGLRGGEISCVLLWAARALPRERRSRRLTVPIPPGPNLGDFCFCADFRLWRR